MRLFNLGLYGIFIVGFFVTSWFSNLATYVSDYARFGDETLVSVADNRCAHLWVEGARNDPTLKCYLTKDAGRLCKQDERNHLAQFLRRYTSSRRDYESALTGYLIRVQTGFYQVEAKDGLEALEKAQRKAAEPLNTPEFKKAVNLDHLTDGEITELFQKLAKNGVLTPDDFGWGTPSYVTDAFSDDFEPSACRNG